MPVDLQVSIALRRIRIGGLGPAITEADLRGLLMAFGPVRSYTRPLNPETSRPDHVAFVGMTDPGATRAVAGLTGRMLRGHLLDVTMQVDGSTSARPAA